MFSATASRGRLIAVAILLFPALLPGQATLATEKASAAAGLQFAEINSSLAKQADELFDGAGATAFPKVSAIESAGGDRTSITDLTDRVTVQSKRRNSTAALSRLESLRPQVEPILHLQGLPAELAAVILVESGANTAALSPKGARGLWQLMPATARRYGLTVDNVRDERLDIQKSTRAAARYLSDLHVQFGSWPLALAAYNTGEQNLHHAIDRSHSAEFPVLSSLGLLPVETRNYVPAVLGAMRSMGALSGSLRNAPTEHGITAFAFTTQ